MGSLFVPFRANPSTRLIDQEMMQQLAAAPFFLR